MFRDRLILVFAGFSINILLIAKNFSQRMFHANNVKLAIAKNVS